MSKLVGLWCSLFVVLCFGIKWCHACIRRSLTADQELQLAYFKVSLPFAYRHQRQSPYQLATTTHIKGKSREHRRRLHSFMPSSGA
ncbi:hypothetical protein DFH11DRAFT_1591136 [Phellopilus nigrolimitatus]|nr:hypothetical protein DFH11DRAFT_1591136 [Phellopilus nigrolimitatus]